MKNLLDFTLDELKEQLSPPFRAKQIFEWLYKKNATSFDEMLNLPKDLRANLAQEFYLDPLKCVKFEQSADGSIKYLFELKDGLRIESVLLPMKEEQTNEQGKISRHARYTVCVSSQVGCKMDCLFCMTGKQGFKGNLSTGEIINQVLSVEESLSLTNIVYMGMGEPLDNAVNVMKSIEVMTASWGLAWSPKRITLSTVGVRRGLERFLSETTCHLAVSLHNPFHEGRLELMPAEGGLPLVDTLQMIREADFTGQRRVSFEYIVFDGVNDSDEHAAELARLLRGIPCRINLIPFHQIPNVPLRPLARDKMEHFKNLLEARGYTTTIRTSRGEDISAACGMLSTKEQMARNTSAN